MRWLQHGRLSNRENIIAFRFVRDTHLSPESPGDQYLFGSGLPPNDWRPV